MPKFDIILVSNSPGELSGYVKPAAETIFKTLKDVRIILVLTPCQYSSGRELEYIATIQGISEVVSPQGYKNWILKNKKPGIDFKERGAVLFLGGDFAHAMLIAKKVRYPALAYTADRIGWAGFYKKFFVPDERTQNKVDPRNILKDKIKVVGDLMVDSVAQFKKWSPEKNVITFMPGSRDWQIKNMTPIYQNIMRLIQAQLPDVRFQLVSSPFEKAPEVEGAKLIDFNDVYNSELVVTIPGTNTARLAALGIPMLMVFPLHNLDLIPVDGLAHYIFKIPFLGKRLKKMAVDTANKQTKFFALPNIKADEEIIKEIRGIIDTSQVAEEIFALVKDIDKRAQMSKELIEAMGKTGAALRISEEIDETLRQTV
jgi:hypothetical protein